MNLTVYELVPSNINNNNTIRFGPVRLYKTIDAVDGLRST